MCGCTQQQKQQERKTKPDEHMVLRAVMDSRELRDRGKETPEIKMTRLQVFPSLFVFLQMLHDRQPLLFTEMPFVIN